ncbi:MULTISPECIES: cytidine deaminase [unclassified Lentimonas]|uniref:cytidine deaminase n=1 Tax=unclassified Lentimonas TaxID=2630993 RepID=UPI00132A44FA|nr:MULTISPECIES: cytidine deaminase [unclassified Lentimonas]CAA6692059.1 Cytidine deaminase (EC [Lentimonas sp. CC10]CAA6693992.1 Cytidine deaminase (EC [Lentimonas sp. CC19]CAA7070257.1 Cytidine deaminase (EC [Lentimonas sp. CC11]
MELKADDFKDALSTLPATEQSLLLNQLCAPQFSGRLTDFASPAIELAQALLPLASTFSIAPLSGFNVGAIAVGASGALYLGSNLEFTGTPLSATLHAEQSAVLNAWMHGERSLQAIAISAAPCGYCRQFLWELPNAPTLPIIVGQTQTTLSELLPMPFGEPRQGEQGLLDSPASKLQSTTPNQQTTAQRAINAAQRSYTPYTHTPEGFVIECADGQHFTGRTAENIAFNPSVPAVLTALNQRNLSNSRNVTIHRCTQAKLATALHSSGELAASIIRGISTATIQTVLVESE